MRRKLIAGNWKMNGSLAGNAALVQGILNGLQQQAAQCDLAVCVSAPYLASCQAQLAGTEIALGAQDVSAYKNGAYTGEVAASMLLEFGCKYVIVGHSERRTLHGETSEMVALKAKAALEAGLIPIICLGETLAEREAGQTDAVVGAQLHVVLRTLTSPQLQQIVLAYEPVWAIGTGKTATPEMAQIVHAMLRTQVAQENAAAASRLQILYGGSMKPENAQQLLAMPDIDGGLIGGAALVAEQFLAIVHAVQAVRAA